MATNSCTPVSPPLAGPNAVHSSNRPMSPHLSAQRPHHTTPNHLNAFITSPPSIDLLSLDLDADEPGLAVGHLPFHVIARVETSLPAGRDARGREQAGGSRICRELPARQGAAAHQQHIQAHCTTRSITTLCMS